VQAGDGVSIEDPKTTLLKLIKDNISLTKDDDVTVATCHVSQEGFNSKAFKNFDTQVTIDLEPARSTVRQLSIGAGKVLYQDCYHVTGWAIDKTGITGKKMRWKLRREIEHIIRSNCKSPSGNLSYVDLISPSESEDLDFKPPWWAITWLVITHRFGGTT